MFRSFRVGFFLAIRQVRANVGTTALIVLVMTLTFLNLLVVSGLMVGIVQGLRSERQKFYTGDIFIENISRETSITDSQEIIAQLRALPEVAAVSARYRVNGVLEANYLDVDGPRDNPDSIVAVISGIDPVAENETTDLSQLIAEGRYLGPRDYDYVLVGTSLLARYKANASIPAATPVPEAGVGDKIRLVINGVPQEVTIAGIVASKVQELTLRVYMNGEQLRQMLGRTNSDVNEIAVSLVPGTDPSAAKEHIASIVAGRAQVE